LFDLKAAAAAFFVARLTQIFIALVCPDSRNLGFCMRTMIDKWGKGAAVRIPSSVLCEVGLSLSSAVTIRAQDGRIVIEPADVDYGNLRLPYSEAQILKGLTSYDIHAEELATLSSVEHID
jgi:antitoxin MazE